MNKCLHFIHINPMRGYNQWPQEGNKILTSTQHRFFFHYFGDKDVRIHAEIAAALKVEGTTD